jgi:pimeloyl-ACP methyl ester carboxylesterase
MAEVELEVVERNLRRDADGSARLRLSPDDERRRRRAAWAHDLSARYRQLTCPVLFVMSEETRLADGSGRAPRASEAVGRELDVLVEELPRSSVRWMPGGHNIPLEQPLELADAVAEFAANVV